MESFFWAADINADYDVIDNQKMPLGVHQVNVAISGMWSLFLSHFLRLPISIF